MYLVLFLVFLGLCFILITLGLYRPEHTEFTLVGFAFLFILSITFINGDVQYKIGVNETNHYGCLCCDAQEGAIPCSDPTNATLVITSVEKVDVYETFTTGGLLSHFVGYWLAVLSFIGFILTLINLKKPEWFRGGGD